MNQQEIHDFIEKGYLHTRIILEIVGKPKEHIDATLKEYVTRIMADEHIKVIEKDFAEPKLIEGDFFSAFAEIEMLIKGVNKFIGFCFDFMPSSIEILAPEKMLFKNNTVSHFLNELQHKLHQMDSVLKNISQENKVLKSNMRKLIENIILISLINRKINLEQLSNVVGVAAEGLQPHIENLIKDGKIKKEGDTFLLA